MTARERIEALEVQLLSPYASKSAGAKGRAWPEPPCPVRTLFQQDIDRIVHAKAFRRLMHKTQVFLNPEGDHYRTRMTHTIEVSRIATVMARALALNEDLSEACALGHDLGHTPFGHAGEQALAALMEDGFTHNDQSLRVVESLERGGRGLNLAFETKDAIWHHSGPVRPLTLEGELVHKADRIAYISSDIDDALRAGILRPGDIPAHLRALTGDAHSERIDAFVRDIIASSLDKPAVSMSTAMEDAMVQLRDFLFEHVYKNPIAKGEESKARDIIHKLFEYYMHHIDALPDDATEVVEQEGAARAVCDYIAGMTDRFAVARFEEIFIPKGWERY